MAVVRTPRGSALLLLGTVRTGVEGNHPWRASNLRGSALTAEAVMRDYESAAKEIETMGAELISAAKKWEAMTADVRNAIRDTAEAYREEGEKIFRAYREVRAVH